MSGRTCAAPSCNRQFVPSSKRPKQAYCSQQCAYKRRRVDDSHKICCRCEEAKHVDDFHPNPGGLLGRHSCCKDCVSKAAAERYRNGAAERDAHHHRRNHARRHYGLTLAEYEAVLDRGCAVCGRHRADGVRMCIDHDHGSGRVRDALCHACNVILGLVSDDPARLRAAADYLEKHREMPTDEAL